MYTVLLQSHAVWQKTVSFGTSVLLIDMSINNGRTVGWIICSETMTSICLMLKFNEHSHILIYYFENSTNATFTIL